MKNLMIKISGALLLVVVLQSCKKYLDIQPRDKFIEQMIFSDLAGASKALNGVYIHIASGSLYGNNLTMGAIDIMGQYYNTGSQHNKRFFQLYDYTQESVLSTMESIWTNAYVGIVNLNKFIENLEKYKGIVPANIESIMKGEAIGLRAMLHFDMLRIFGPRYSTADSTSPSIPYYKRTSTTVAPILAANEAMDSIVADLLLAEQLLQNDPIITGGINTGESGDGYEFFRNRNQRLNYFAVKGLQARVYMYRGAQAAALAASKYVIENADAFFPWITASAIMSDNINPNRVFSTEVLFGAFSSNLYATHNNLFSADLQDNSILAPLDARLKTLFENNENDYRYNPLWKLPTTNKSYRTFFKYADIADKSRASRFLIPLIRKSEMYYIAAECEPDAATAIGYLNTVRFNRGLVALPNTVNKHTELQKEYQKEFIGEGQLFFYYKRRNVTTIPNPTATSGNVTLSGTNAAKYVVPLPLSETLYR